MKDDSKIQDVEQLIDKIAQKDEEINKYHAEVYDLNSKFKKQEKDLGDVIHKLTRENEEKMQRMIYLENQIQTLEKSNEKKSNEVVQDMEGKITRIKTDGTEKIKTSEVKMSELQENLDQMDETRKEKLKYEFELMAW